MFTYYLSTTAEKVAEQWLTEEYMSLVTRIIMHIKDKGSKKHGVMGQPNQQQGPGPGGQMGVPMSGGQTNMGMMNQMNPMTSMSQMGVNVMGQPGMVHQMQQSQLVQQMQPGINQAGQMMGGMNQQQSNQQSQQQHQISQQGQNQMMGQGQMTLGLNQGQIQMQQIQNAQMGNPQMQQQLQMQNVQMQQALMQGNSNQIMMTGGQQQVMMQGNQPQQTMIGGGQPQMMMQGNQPQQQGMMQATSQGQQGVMSGGQQQQSMMQGGPQQQQQQQQQSQGMMSGPPQQSQPGNPQQQQMMQVRGIPNPQMVGNRLMNPNAPNVSNTLTALAHAQQQRKAQQQRPMVSNVDNVPVNVQFSGVPGGAQMQQRPVGSFVPSNSSQGMPSPSPGGINVSGYGFILLLTRNTFVLRSLFYGVLVIWLLRQCLRPQPPPQSTFVNSPGSQNIMHRPPGPGVNVNSLSPFPNSMINVPSPNTNLNTPMPMAPTPSPRNAEEQAYMEKSSKMKKLLEILTNPNQRVSMEILLKCEAALKKMERSQLDPGGVLGPASVSAPTPQPKDQTSPFQQIQDSILLSLKSGASSHTFLRTFRQSVEALTGQPFATPPDPVEQEPEFLYYPDMELSVDIPSVLRRELKIVDNRFKVKVIKNPRSSLSLVIHVSLTESRLPRVPPLKIFIPPDYPDESPSVLDLRSEYGFLNSVARTLKSRLLYLPQRFTVLELLGCWEMSVRQVCNPNYKSTAASRKKLSNSLALAFL
ncbi:Mediator of RNA polymerase II transcription subunit 15, partial [Orchesella cincta]